MPGVAWRAWHQRLPLSTRTYVLGTATILLSFCIKEIFLRFEVMSASLAPECNDPKERYDSCFLKWYSESTSSAPITMRSRHLQISTEYLRGNSSTDECEPLFKAYKGCLQVR